MQATITLTEKQVALLLQILDEKLSLGEIEDSERPLAFAALSALEFAENEVYSNS